MNEMQPIDKLLTAFFRSEAPSPWPPAPAASTTPLRRRANTLDRSRFVLAASLLALMIGGWILAARTAWLPGRPASLEGTTATRPADVK